VVEKWLYSAVAVESGITSRAITSGSNEVFGLCFVGFEGAKKNSGLGASCGPLEGGEGDRCRGKFVDVVDFDLDVNDEPPAIVVVGECWYPCSIDSQYNKDY
jgi:hypothetical protein